MTIERREKLKRGVTGGRTAIGSHSSDIIVLEVDDSIGVLDDSTEKESTGRRLAGNSSHTHRWPHTELSILLHYKTFRLLSHVAHLASDAKKYSIFFSVPSVSMPKKV